MSGLDAVVELICEAKSFNRDDRRVCFLRKVIEKDLELLKLLKKYSYLYNDKRLFISLESMTPEEAERVKEWLKND